MTTKKYILKIKHYEARIEKVYRTKTQFEYYLDIFLGDSNYRSPHKYQELHLTRKSAINEAKRVIENNIKR